MEVLHHLVAVIIAETITKEMAEAKKAHSRLPSSNLMAVLNSMNKITMLKRTIKM